MRSPPRLADSPIFSPRVRYIALQDIMFLYRWCFTDAELIDLWKEGTLSELRDLRASVTFYSDAKTHRRREFATLIRHQGWMRVAAGICQPDGDGVYLLCSAFDSHGEPLEFLQLDAYFDFVRAVGPMEFLPDDVNQRLMIDIQRHCELSKEHLKQQIRHSAKLELAEQEAKFEALSGAAEARLSELRRQIRETSDQSDRESLILFREDLRQSLLEIESAELDAIRMSLSDRRHVDLRASTLFTLAWSIEKG